MLVHQGVLPQNAQNLQRLVDSRPFTHQVDVIFTASEEPAAAHVLATLQTSCYRTRTTFSELFAAFASSSSVTALSLGSLTTENVWCLDTRGILSLSLTEDTYQRLGVSNGVRARDTPTTTSVFLCQVVTLDLLDTTPVAVRVRGALEQWDIQRTRAGEEGWDVLLSASYEPGIHAATKQDIQAHLETMSDAWVPSCIPSINSDTDHEEVAALFEWVGLASLGSQRLLVNDRVNPYVAAYEPPSGSSGGKITHLRWTGFLPSTFIHSILNQVLMKTEGVRAISALSFDAPVSHISSSGTTLEGENVWTLIVSEAVQDPTINGETGWLLTEHST